MIFKTVRHSRPHFVTKLFAAVNKRIKFGVNQKLPVKTIMTKLTKYKVLFLLLFSIVIVWRNYTIVIGQQATAAKTVLVALNKAGASLTIIDPKDMKTLGSVPVGEGPHEVVLSADGKTAFVANYGNQTPGSTLSVVDLVAKKEIRRVDLTPLLRPHGLQEVGGKIYFTSETNRLIGRYDPATNRVDWLMGTGQNATHMIVVMPDQKRIYTANIGSDTVTAFEATPNPNNPWKMTHIAVGKQPEAIEISPDGKEVWAGLNAEGAIDVIDAATNKVKEKLKIGQRPYRIRFTPDGKKVLLTVLVLQQGQPPTGEFVVLDAATRKELKRMKLDGVPFGVVTSKDGKTAFVTTVQTDGVQKIDLEKYEVLGKATAGQAPDGIALGGM
jgi:YVTN family beta-propeller protein